MAGVRQLGLVDLGAELARRASSVRSKTSRTPGSIPSASVESSRGTPMRRPFRSSREGSSTPPGMPIAVESRGSGAGHRAQQQGGVA